MGDDPGTGDARADPRGTAAHVRVAQRVGPEQVGRRVVLRRVLADGSAGDLLGDLVRWDPPETPEPRVTVRTRAGDVTVAASDVLGGKPVPPAPPRRGRPHRTIDWRELEDVASDGWQALETGRVDGDGDGPGWLLRAAAGFTGRANSALAVGPPGLPLMQALDQVERWYAARDLPPRLAVPWPLSVRRTPGPEGVDTDLDRELARRGYRWDTPTLVMTAAAREVAVATTPLGGAPLPDVRVDLEPDDAWLAVYHYRGEALPAVARRLLLSAPAQAFLSVRDNSGGGDGRGAERAVAVTRAASSRGWTGITAMEVDPDHRRRGLARALLARVAAWAAERGDECLYLQVAETSSSARALYEAAGFAAHHGYHYRVLDPA